MNDFPCNKWIAEQNATHNVLMATQKSGFATVVLNIGIQCAQNKSSLKFLLCKVADRKRSLNTYVTGIK